MSGVFTFLAPGLSASSERPAVTLRGDLPPVRATYGDFLLLSKDIQAILESSSVPNSDQRERPEHALIFRVASKETSLTSGSLEALIAENRLPNPARTFRISTSGYGFGEDSIRDIDISFRDRFSYYDLQGTNIQILQSIQTRIEGFAEAHRNRLGSPGFAFVMYGLITVISLIMVSLSPARHTLSPMTILGMRIAGVVILAAAYYSLFFDRLFDLFPTIAIYKGSASVFVRYGPEFTSLGIVIGSIAIIATVLLTRKPRERSPEQVNP